MCSVAGSCRGCSITTTNRNSPPRRCSNTNRVWCSNLRNLRELFLAAKVIACVRHVPWIIDSIEQLIRRNALQPSSIFNYQSSGTVYLRSEGLANGDGMVGLHTVRRKIALHERTSILPPDVFRRFENDAFWRDPQFNLRGVRVV